MTEQQRASAPAPMIENIPSELMELTQWVVWAFEERNGKRTKVPYTPGETKKARSNAPSTWRSFRAAYSCYQERPDYFDGIGFMFAKDDPYVGGDIDHCIAGGVISDHALAALPGTYAEISPSGCGIKFIARASGDYGRKTARGELYSSGRFFTITGNALAGHGEITECQDEIDAFLAGLGAVSRENRQGTAGSGSRAQNAASIPEEAWAEGRRLLREEINRWVSKLRNSARPKAVGKESQLYFVLQNDLNGLQDRYPLSGAVRSDGSIDLSQVRAIFASGMRMRGFTFPQFVALFYHFYGAECLAKWGTTQAFREEAATLWLRGRTPRTGEAEPPKVQPAPRGRAGSHTDLLERTYAVLLTYRAGSDAIVMLNDVAHDLGVHKGTASRAIKALTGTRISTERHGQHGGLLIHFLPELIYSEGDASNPTHSNGVDNETMSAEAPKATELIYPNGIPHNNGVKHEQIPANDESPVEPPELIYSEDAKTELGSTDTRNKPPVLGGEREEDRPYIEGIYRCPSVFLQGAEINSQNRIRDRVGIADAVTAAFDALPRDRTIAATGELKRWPITADRVLAFVQEHYSEQGWRPDAVLWWVDRIRKRRRGAVFDELRSLRREALEKKAAAARRKMEAHERRAETHESLEARDWHAKRAGQLSGQMAMLGWELGRRDSLDDVRIERDGYTQGEMAEMLSLVEPPVPRTQADVGGLIARLKARRQNE